MAAKKKKAGPRPTVRRGPVPSIASPGDMTPSPAPSFRDQTKKTQDAIISSMAKAGKEAYGYPITMEDSVNTRVQYLEDAIARSPNGVPTKLDWYEEHQNDVRAINASSNIGAPEPVPLGRSINATAPASIRNKPVKETKAVRSGGWIAAHPDATVTVTGDISKAVKELTKGKHTVPEGTHRLGHLNPVQIATLGRAETISSQRSGEGRSLDRGITSATLDSSGYKAATNIIALARGADFDTVIKDGPKISNYAHQTHMANSPQTAYNKEVFWRRHNDPVFVEGGNHQVGPQIPGSADKFIGPKLPGARTPGADGPYWRQGHLLSASQMSGFIPESQPDLSVEDYIGAAMSAEVASKKGKKGASARKAQDIVKVKKGKKGTLPADLSPSEMAHSFHEEATHRAAQKFAATSLTEEGPVLEAPVMVGTQAATWTEWQEQNNSPKEQKPKKTKEETFTQGTLF